MSTRNERYTRLVIAAAFALSILVGALATQATRYVGLIDSFEHWTADWRSALLGQTVPTAHKKIAVVLIDEETLERFGAETRSPTDRALIADLIKAICATGPKVLALDFIFDMKTRQDQVLRDAMKTPCRLVLGAVIPPTRQTSSQEKFQASFLRDAGHPHGFVNVTHEFDDVVRLQVLDSTSADTTFSFAEATARAAGVAVSHQRRRISWLSSEAGAEPFPTFPAHFILPALSDGEKSRQGILALLSDRVVLLGIDLTDADRHRTPLSKLSGSSMLGTTVQAHLVAQLLDGRSERELRESEKAVLCAALFFLGVLVGFTGARLVLLSFSVPIVLFVAASAIAFKAFTLALPFAICAIAWGLGVVLGRGFSAMGRWVFRNENTRRIM
jgi:adenylate cyclase